MNTTTNNKHFTFAAAAAVCLACVAVGAHANGTAYDVPARTVQYADLNLYTQAGAAALYTRIRHAAEQVCGDVGSRELAEAAAAKACVNRAIFSSVHSVNNLRLTNEYNRHIGTGSEAINVASLR